MLTKRNNIAKVGTYPHISQNIGAIPFETLLEVVDWTDIAHLRRNPQKVGLTALTGSMVALTPQNKVQEGGYMCGVEEVNSSRAFVSPFTVGSRQKVGSNKQLGGIYVY